MEQTLSALEPRWRAPIEQALENCTSTGNVSLLTEQTVSEQEIPPWWPDSSDIECFPLLCIEDWFLNCEDDKRENQCDLELVRQLLTQNDDSDDWVGVFTFQEYPNLVFAGISELHGYSMHFHGLGAFVSVTQLANYILDTQGRIFAAPVVLGDDTLLAKAACCNRSATSSLAGL